MRAILTFMACLTGIACLTPVSVQAQATRHWIAETTVTWGRGGSAYQGFGTDAVGSSLVGVSAEIQRMAMPLGARDLPLTVQQDGDQGGGWKKGLLIGALVGIAFGVAAHAVVDGFPCDTCSGTGSSSAAEGTRLEFTIGFGLLGAGVGALLGR